MGKTREGKRSGTGAKGRGQPEAGRAAGSDAGLGLHRARAARGLTEGPDQSSALGPLRTGTSNWGRARAYLPAAGLLQKLLLPAGAALRRAQHPHAPKWI